MVDILIIFVGLVFAALALWWLPLLLSFYTHAHWEALALVFTILEWDHHGNIGTFAISRGQGYFLWWCWAFLPLDVQSWLWFLCNREAPALHLVNDKIDKQVTLEDMIGWNHEPYAFAALAIQVVCWVEGHRWWWATLQHFPTECRMICHLPLVTSFLDHLGWLRFCNGKQKIA